MIPDNISREHVIKAIEEIELNGIPKGRHSVKWSLLFNSKQYPPKFVISKANIYANNEEWEPSKFSGGDESNSFLKHRGFTIIASGTKELSFPIESYSWKILSETIAVKYLDKSSFLHHGTGIPADIRFFFNLEELKPDEKREIILTFKDKKFTASFQFDAVHERIRLFWKSDFDKLLRDEFPNHYDAHLNGNDIIDSSPGIRLKSLDDAKVSFTIDWISSVTDISSDIKTEATEDKDELQKEGRVQEYYGKRYERDPRNRQKAIEYHGNSCVVCGFNFEETYGERGKGFIEVHHAKPLSTLDEETLIDPKTDLFPVCSNCHRMIHRKKDDILGVEDLKQLRIRNN